MKKLSPYLIFFAAMLWATDAPFRMYLTKDLNSNFIVLAEHFVDLLFIAPGPHRRVYPLEEAYSQRMDGGHLHRCLWERTGIGCFYPVIPLCQSVGGNSLAETSAIHRHKPRGRNSEGTIDTAVLGMGNRCNPGRVFGFLPGLKPELFPGEQFNPNIIGVAYALLAAIFWGASTVFGKYVLRNVDFKIVTALRFSVGFVFMVILNVSTGSIPTLSQVNLADWIYIVIISVASGVVALFIYYKGLENTSASVATIAELGFPMAAVIINWFFLGAGLVPTQLAGMGILVFAIFRLTRL